MRVDYSLYLVTDRGILGDKSIVDAVEEAIRGGVTIVQLREKEESSLEFYNIAKVVREITNKYNIPLIINDRVDIAMAVNAEGVHVGQSDLPIAVVREIIGKDKIVGVSASNMELALKAEMEGADYIGVGAVFNTTTKLNTNEVTIESLKKIKESINIPVVAIGGIGRSNVYKLQGTKIDGVAVISDILGSVNIEEATMELKKNCNF